MLAAALELPWPGSRRTVRREELELEDAPTTVFGDRGPAVVLLNGATALGRRHPRVIAVAEALARAGHTVLVPDLHGVDRGEISARTVAAALRAVRAAEGRAALLGISVGTTVGLLVAEELPERISVVAGLAGYTDLTDLIRLATTGHHRDGARLAAYPAGPFLGLCIARSVCASVPEEFAGVEPDEEDPFACVRGLAGPAARLLANGDPRRFDELYAALPAEVRAPIDRLSPVAGAARLAAPVEILTGPRDKYFPLGQQRALARAAPSVRLTVTPLLEHADARLGARDVPELVRVLAFCVRTLRLASLP